MTASTSASSPVLTTEPAPLRVQVWSDVVCPWCYVGKRRLEAAVSQFSGADVELVWRSFQLDPSAPHPGEPGHRRGVAEHLGEKYGGGLAAGQAMSEQMTQVAAGDGLDFRLDLAGVVNTTDAHRVLHLARAVESETRAPGLQDRVKESFLSAYFTLGRDVSDHDVLRELAEQAGMPGERVAEVLGSTAYAGNVTEDQQQAVAYGATGVPFTVVDGRYGVSGAQPVDVFLQALQRARADRQGALVTLTSDAGVHEPGHEHEGSTECGPDGCEIH
ncbi:MAG: DsbA family oxidoreductase [Ornithinimicrobium sp.]